MMHVGVGSVVDALPGLFEKLRAPSELQGLHRARLDATWQFALLLPLEAKLALFDERRRL
jgi:hypothetical protein